MDPSVMSGLISLGGIGLSGLVAYFVATRQIEQKYSELLYQRRLNCYPDLYEIVSEFVKRISFDEVTRDQIVSFAAKLDSWDSKYAILLSPAATEAIYDLRYVFRDFIDREGLTFDEQNTQQLIRKSNLLENALKTELGVYSRNRFHNPKTVKGLSYYRPSFRAKKRALPTIAPTTTNSDSH